MFRGSPERLKKVTVEVIHVGKYDLVVNRSVDSRSAVKFVQKKLSQSDPGYWGAEDDYDSMKFEPPGRPRFVIKMRPNNRDFMRSVFWGTFETHRDFEFGKEANYAVNSVMNEIMLSLPIAKVVNDESIQDLIKSYGFQHMKYVPALLAIIDRRNGYKYVVYPYVEGLNEYEEDKWPHDFNAMKAKVLTEKLKQLMRNAGIEAEDLFPRQLIVNTDTIYLVDAEEYRRTH